MNEPQHTDDEFEDTPHGWGQRWRIELDCAKETYKHFHEAGDVAYTMLLDEGGEQGRENETRLNLFASTVRTVQSLLYGRIPQVNVGRKFPDAQDDVARAAGNILQRMLNGDILAATDTYASTLKHALENRLVPGLGCMRLRHMRTMETVPGKAAILDVVTGLELAPAIPDSERVADEHVECMYVHWKDILFGAAKVWEEVPWVAFKASMRKRDVVERFGEDVARTVNFEGGTLDKDNPGPWARATIWEIWDKDTRRVYWMADEGQAVLDMEDDPYGLASFLPMPRPLMANISTEKLVPRSDYAMAQNQYRQVNELSTRIERMEKAVAVRGVYDGRNENLQNLLTDSPENALLAVTNWGNFAQQGGLRGSLDFLPLDVILSAIAALDGRREVVKSNLYEVTGMSDLLRGQVAAAAGGPATATEQSLKARFGSVRLQYLELELATFASEAQALKAEIIANRFDKRIILERSNVLNTPDAPLAEAAIELLRSDVAQYRIQVRSEALAMSDYAQLKSDREGALTAISGYVSALMPVANMFPGSMPDLLKVLVWALTGQRGSAELESILDPLIAKAQQMANQPQAAAAPPPPDPKLEVQRMKGQQKLEEIQAHAQADSQRNLQEVQGKAILEQNQTDQNVREAALKAALHRPVVPTTFP